MPLHHRHFFAVRPIAGLAELQIQQLSARREEGLWCGQGAGRFRGNGGNSAETAEIARKPAIYAASFRVRITMPIDTPNSAQICRWDLPRSFN